MLLNFGTKIFAAVLISWKLVRFINQTFNSRASVYLLSSRQVDLETPQRAPLPQEQILSKFSRDDQRVDDD